MSLVKTSCITLMLFTILMCRTLLGLLCNSGFKVNKICSIFLHVMMINYLNVCLMHIYIYLV